MQMKTPRGIHTLKMLQQLDRSKRNLLKIQTSWEWAD